MGTKGVWASPNFLEKSINEPKGKHGKKECGNTYVLMALKTLALFHIFLTNGLLTLF
jgi:hypothetical protein